MRIFDQIDDCNLTKLAGMLNNFLPYDWFEHSVNPIDDILPLILNNGIDGIKLIMNEPPESDIKVIDTPNGKAIIKTMRKKHGSFIASNGDDIDSLIPSMFRNSLKHNGCEFAFGDKFPVGDPFQALMSLIYALAQKSSIGSDNFDGVVKPKIEDTLGTDTVQKVIDIITKLQNGSEEVIDENLKKKITITVDDYADAANKARNGDDAIEAEFEEVSDNKKESALKYMYTNTSKHRMAKYNRMMKHAGKVQTSLFKLADVLTPFSHLDRVQNFINMLKNAMMLDQKITIASADIQTELLNKLSTIFKNIDNSENDDFIKDLIYNTDMPSDTGEIVYIDALVNNYDDATGKYKQENIKAPVDVEKMKNLSYADAEKALTGSVADEMFNAEKTEVDMDKFRDFLTGIQKLPGDAEEKQEIVERIIEPILLMFSPDNDVMENIGVPAEDIKSESEGE